MIGDRAMCSSLTYKFLTEPLATLTSGKWLESGLITLLINSTISSEIRQRRRKWDGVLKPREGR